MKTAQEKDTKTMENKKVEVSALITKAADNPPEVTYFTSDGKRVPEDSVVKEKTEAGTKFFVTPETL